MKLFSRKTLLEISNQVLVNLTSGWFGIVLIAPGIFGVSSAQQYLELLIKNLPFAIIGLTLCVILAERIKII
jgi:hypothetical protein